jgi:putative endonuclease
VRVPKWLGAYCFDVSVFGAFWCKAYNKRVPEYFCYILECADGTLYTGWTMDPERRLREHNAGYGARYTRSRRPLRIAYLEQLPDRAAAMQRERAIKSMPRRKKIALLHETHDDGTHLPGG